MNTRAPLLQAALLAALALASAPAVAAGADAALAPSEGIRVDCRRPALPRQQAIGELAGQHNLAQVYATRQRAMGEVRRACHREGVAAVLLVPRRQPAVSTQAPRQIAGIRRPAK